MTALEALFCMLWCLGVAACLGFYINKLIALQSRFAALEASLRHLHNPDLLEHSLLARARATPVTSIEPLTGKYTLQCPHCRHEHTCFLSRLPTEKDPT